MYGEFPRSGGVFCFGEKKFGKSYTFIWNSGKVYLYLYITLKKKTMKTFMTFAKLNTRNNDYGINSKDRVKVIEQHHNFITCRFMYQGRVVTADFGRSEVVRIWQKEYIGNVIPAFGR